MRHLKWLVVVVAVAALPIWSVLHAWRVAPLLGALSGNEDPALTPESLVAGRAAIAPSPDPALHLGLANLLHSVHREEEALAEYHTAIELAPENRAARVGLLLVLLDRWQTAGGGLIAPELAAALAAGRQAEPDNALYDFVEGAAMVVSGVVVTEPVTENGPVTRTVTDPPAVARGLALLAAGNAKPSCETYERELGQATLAYLGEQLPGLNPLLRFNAPLHRPISHCLLLGRLRKTVPALTPPGAALEAVIGLGTKLGARTRSVICLAVANGLVLAAERELLNDHRKSGRYQAADALQTALTKHEAVFAAVGRLPAGVDERQLGLLDAMAMPSSGWRDYDPGLNRRMEYAFLELVLLTGLSLVLLVIAVLALSGACAARGETPAPRRLEWRAREVVWLYLGGLLLPLFAYLLFDRFHFTREYGLGQLAEVVFTQTGAVALLIATLIVTLAGRAVRRKLAGAAPPVAVPRGRFALLVYAAVAVFVSCFWLGGSVGDNDAALLLLGTFGLAALAVFIRSLFTRVLAPGERRLYLTSLAALLLGAVVLLTIIQVAGIHPYFNRNFRAYKVAVLDRLAEDEVAATNWLDLRNHFGDDQFGAGGSVIQ